MHRAPSCRKQTAGPQRRGGAGRLVQKHDYHAPTLQRPLLNAKWRPAYPTNMDVRLRARQISKEQLSLMFTNFTPNDPSKRHVDMIDLAFFIILLVIMPKLRPASAGPTFSSHVPKLHTMADKQPEASTLHNVISSD